MREAIVIQRTQGHTHNDSTVWKGVGIFEKDTGTQRRDRISQAGVREGLSEVTILKWSQRRQMEFQQTKR